MKFIYIAGLAAATLLAPSLATAQSCGCADQNTMIIGASSEGSNTGTSCGSGVSFTVKGVSFTPQASNCPFNVTYTPPREVPSGTLAGYFAAAADPVEITKQDYKCSGLGCGWLYLSSCCNASGAPSTVNTASNFKLTKCKKIVVTPHPSAPTRHG